MTQIFIAHAKSEEASAARIRGDLEVHGYTVWQDKSRTDPASISYPRAIENGIRGSAALILIWSAAAADDEWVEREFLSAQRLKKSLVVVLTDAMELPITLINVPSITSLPPCADAVAQLLPHLPPPDQDDLLLALLTHDYIRKRKAGIQRAADMLQRGEDRERVLALLEDMARNDLFEGVREAAQAVLTAEVGKGSPSPSEESRHVFGARCPNGHVTFFDKRVVCPSSGTIKRSTAQRAGKDLDELYLKCGTCGVEITPKVDCEGYK